MADSNKDPKTGQSDKVTDQKPAQTPAPAGTAQKGGTNPNDRSKDGAAKTPVQPTTGTVINVNLNDDVRNNGAQVGEQAIPKAKGRPGDPWGMQAYTEARREAQHQKNVAMQAAKSAEAKARRERISREYADRKQKVQAEIESGNFTNLTTISADTWKKLGGRDGKIRTEYEKNEDGSLISDGNGGYKQKAYENGGSMFDATKGAEAVQKLEKWWAEEGVATSQGAIPKGVFDENGKLKTDGLTADQVGALQKIMENSQAKLAPIRRRAEMNGIQNYLKDSDYVSSKGMKVFDTKTGERLMTKEQVSQAAREMRMRDARAALQGLTSPESKNGDLENELGGARSYFDDAGFDQNMRAKDEAALVAKMRALGFRADQIADDTGKIDYGRIAQALGNNPEDNVAEVEIPGDNAPAKAKPKAKAAPAETPETPDVEIAAKAQAGLEELQRQQEEELLRTSGADALRTGEEANQALLQSLKEKATSPAEQPVQAEEQEPPAPLMTEGTRMMLGPDPKSPTYMQEMLAAAARRGGKAPVGPSDPSRSIMNGYVTPEQRDMEALGVAKAYAKAVGIRPGEAQERLDKVVNALGIDIATMGAGPLVSRAIGAVGKPVMRAASRAKGKIVSAVQRGAQKATARVAANPGFTGAVRETAEVANMTGAQRTMRAIDQARRNAPAAVARREALQKAADVRKANEAVEAAKTGAEKTMDAVGRFNARMAKARPKSGPKAKRRHN